MFLNPLHLLGTEYVVLLFLVAREARQAVHDEAGNIVETMKPGSWAAGQPGSRAAGQPGSRAAGQPGSRAAGQPGSRAARQPAKALQGPHALHLHRRPFNLGSLAITSLSQTEDAHGTRLQRPFLGVPCKSPGSL